MKSIPEKRPASPPPHKKILFMNGNSRLIRALWSAECDEKAARYGFEVAIPARDRDLPAETWPQLLPEYDGVITSWGSPVCTAELLARPGSQSSAMPPVPPPPSPMTRPTAPPSGW